MLRGRINGTDRGSSSSCSLLLVVVIVRHGQRWPEMSVTREEGVINDCT